MKFKFLGEQKEGDEGSGTGGSPSSYTINSSNTLSSLRNLELTSPSRACFDQDQVHEKEANGVLKEIAVYCDSPHTVHFHGS